MAVVHRHSGVGHRAERRYAAHRSLRADYVVREAPVGRAPDSNAEALPIVELRDAHRAKAPAVGREAHLRDRRDRVEVHGLASREIDDAHDTAEPAAPFRQPARALKCEEPLVGRERDGGDRAARAVAPMANRILARYEHLGVPHEAERDVCGRGHRERERRDRRRIEPEVAHLLAAARLDDAHAPRLVDRDVAAVGRERVQRVAGRAAREVAARHPPDDRQARGRIRGLGGSSVAARARHRAPRRKASTPRIRSSAAHAPRSARAPCAAASSSLANCSSTPLPAGSRKKS